jgi:hypothetical protein
MRSGRNIAAARFQRRRCQRVRLTFMVYATNFNAVGADILNALRLVPQYRISNVMNVSSRPSDTTVKADENVTSPSILKRSIVLGSHKTSVSLEDEFWNSLRQIAGTRRESLLNRVLKKPMA